MSQKPPKVPILTAPETAAPKAPGDTPLFSAAFMRLLAVQLAFGFSYSAFLLLPKFLKTELDATASEIGWVSGVALVAAAVAAPLVGRSSAYVSRRALLAASLLAAGASGLLFPLATDVGLPVYALRTLQGVAWVLVFNCTATMTADLVPKARISQAIGFLGVAMMVTNALAPAVVEPAAARFGWGLAFGVPAVLSLLALALIPQLARDQVSQRVGGTPTLSRALFPLFYASGVMGAGLGVMFTFTQPFALALGANRVGDFFFGYVGTALFVRIFLSRIADRVGPHRVATLSLVPYALTLFLTADLTPEKLIFLGAMLGASHGFMYPALMGAGLADLTQEERPVFMGWITFSFNAGFAVCVLGLGPVADAVGYPTIFLATGVVVATGLIPMVLGQGTQQRLEAKALDVTST